MSKAALQQLHTGENDDNNNIITARGKVAKTAEIIRLQEVSCHGDFIEMFVYCSIYNIIICILYTSDGLPIPLYNVRTFAMLAH